MLTLPTLASLLAVRLANPVTPWVVLALCIAGWLAVYLYVTSEPRR